MDHSKQFLSHRAVEFDHVSLSSSANSFRFFLLTWNSHFTVNTVLRTDCVKENILDKVYLRIQIILLETFKSSDMAVVN